MTLQDYRRIEEALAIAEGVAEERSPATKAGKEIRDEVRALLKRVTLERIRAEVAAESAEKDRNRPREKNRR